MKIFVDPKRAPLVDVPAAMQERRMAEIQKMLTQSGLTLSDSVNNDGSLNVSVRNLHPDQREHVIATLDAIGVCRVDLEPADLERLNGGANIFTHSAARGIESGVESVTSVTSHLAPEELFGALDNAASAVLADRVQSPELASMLRPGIEADLLLAGLIDGNHTTMEDYDTALRAKYQPDLPELSGDFAPDVPRYRSPFES